MEPKVQELVDELQQQVAARRLHGDYPAGMERELEAEFCSLRRGIERDELDDDGLERRLRLLGDAVERISGTAPAASSVPLGALVHRSTGRLIGRHTTHVAQSVREVGDSTLGALTEIERLLRAQRTADERQLNEVISAVIDRLEVIDELVSAVRSIEHRLLQLERSEQPDQ
jgi:hypothetical protein